MADPANKRDPADRTGETGRAEQRQPRDGGQPVVHQSDSPVDVPRAPVPAAEEDSAPEENTPRDDERVQSPWADRELPAPNATRVRRHYNG